MQVVYSSATRQGSTVELYHGGYLTVNVTKKYQFGYQFYTEEDYDLLIAALTELRDRNFKHRES